METIGSGLMYGEASYGASQPWEVGMGRSLPTSLPGAADRVSVFPPLQSSLFPAEMSSGMPGAGLFASLLGTIQSLLGQLTQMLQGGSAQAVRTSQQYFSNATLSSTGDPHDAFIATSADSGKLNRTWDNMNSHDHLITSESVPGGFNVATRVTPPTGNKGATFNSCAAVTTNNGNTTVTMGKDGAFSIVDDGRPVSLGRGQTTTLSNGETVAMGANGSLTVGVADARGGTISTMLSSDGNGVDVNATANNVLLGGYLVNARS